MIRLHIMVPLPSVLKFTEDGGPMILELSYYKGISVNSILKELAGNYPGFKKITEDRESNRIANMMIFVNGKILSSRLQRENLLADDSEIKLMAPYTGG